MTDTLETYYSAGGPFIPPAVLRAGQQGLLAVALLISALFLANFVWMWSSGKRPSPVKLVLLITSISFWWYCNNIVASVLDATIFGDMAVLYVIATLVLLLPSIAAGVIGDFEFGRAGYRAAGTIAGRRN